MMMTLPVDWLMFAQAAPAAEEQGQLTALLLLAVIVGIFVVPFALGSLIGRGLGQKDLSFKIGVVLFTAFLGLTPFVWQEAFGGQWTDAMRPGIDLAGGTNLVFQVNFDAAEKEIDDPARVMDQMVGAVARRLDPAGQEQITVRRVGADRIEVIIPRADRDIVERKKKMMTRLGSLEFAILANQRDHSDIIRRAQDVPRDLRENKRVVATWRQVGVGPDGQLKDVEPTGEVAYREVEREGQTIPEFLVLVEPENDRVTGKYLTRAYESVSESGMPSVGFTFNSRGGFLFQRLTGENQPGRDGFKRRLSILLDGKIHTAPVLNSVISNQGVIEGQFSNEEIAELINVLNAGALEVPINPNPISEASISPLLGIDVQKKGMRAIMWAGMAVLIFMLVYYMFAGVVADLCLALNLVLLLGAMALIEATLTLPGLAGIVLTIGMSVDANVLIFERIREERNRGSSLRIAIQNGFGRALSAIVDANVTTLITAIVLYMIGTDQVRGFAVTLFIGIMLSMYTALFFGRLMFDIFERKRWLTELKMLSIVGTTHWNFTSKKLIAAGMSLVLIVIGVGTLYARGKENLDIDFTGGTMVTFEFVNDEDIDEIRGVLQGKLGTAITLEQLTLADEETSGDGTGRRFRLRTSQQNIQNVRGSVNEALVDHELRKVTMQFGDFGEVGAPVGNGAAANGANGAGEGSTDENGTNETDAGASAEGELADAADEGSTDEAVEEADTDETDAANETNVAEIEESEFAGGSEVTLEFFEGGQEGEIPVATAIDYLSQEILGLTDAEGTSRYDEPASLFSLTGTEGSGLQAEAGTVQRFKTMVLQVSPELPEQDLRAALDGMQATLAANPIFDEINTFDSAIASEMQQSAIMALLASMLAIVGYLWIRFQRVTFGLAAVAAVFHDVLVVVGMVALASYASQTAFGRMLELEDFKINLPMIAAFLTIVGYSLNDTIVVFDRVREVRGKNPALTEEMVNTSLNQTLSRTILTSLTTFLVVAILYAIGGEGIHGFAFCLVVGVVVGTYSSIYVASPVLLWLMNRPEGASTKAAA